jgi:hypothetical protein
MCLVSCYVNVLLLFFFSAKLVDLAYGIKKLQIMCTVEDEKVSVEDLREEIEAFEDLVSLFLRSVISSNGAATIVIVVKGRTSKEGAVGSVRKSSQTW